MGGLGSEVDEAPPSGAESAKIRSHRYSGPRRARCGWPPSVSKRFDTGLDRDRAAEASNAGWVCSRGSRRADRAGLVISIRVPGTAAIEVPEFFVATLLAKPSARGIEEYPRLDRRESPPAFGGHPPEPRRDVEGRADVWRRSPHRGSTTCERLRR